MSEAMGARSAEELDELVRQAQGGSSEAFDAMVLALHTEVRLSLAGFHVSEGLTEEVLQATFVTAYQKLSTYEVGRLTFRGWLKAIARNILLKELREQRRFAEQNHRRIEVQVIDSAIEEAAHAEALENAYARMRGCLDKLDQTARQLVEARYLEREAIPALARRLGRPDGWVSVRLFRIRQALRACMEGNPA